MMDTDIQREKAKDVSQPKTVVVELTEEQKRRPYVPIRRSLQNKQLRSTEGASITISEGTQKILDEIRRKRQVVLDVADEDPVDNSDPITPITPISPNFQAPNPVDTEARSFVEESELERFALDELYAMAGNIGRTFGIQIMVLLRRLEKKEECEKNRVDVETKHKCENVVNPIIHLPNTSQTTKPTVAKTPRIAATSSNLTVNRFELLATAEDSESDYDD